ncbi:hypothetical protein C8R46DRAFT_1343826 [Mycena filopes]|nr:hypothetical protein C8R46DRAFT_1343826 [Mycena filopes]
MDTLPPHISGDEDGPVFPPELLEIIIQNLRGSNATLKELGLVSRACLSASRRILHQSVSVPSERTASFLDLISSPENTYIAALEAIEIGLEEPTTAALLPHLPQFPRLKRIDILPTTFVFTYQFPVMPLITTLSLHAAAWHAPTIFHSRADIQTLLSSFPGLKNLNLGPVRWVYTPPSARSRSVVPPPQRELDTLSIPASQMDAQFIVTLASDVFALWPRALVVDLRRVELSSQILRGLNAYLRLLGSHLHTLRVKLGTYSSPLEVSSNPALHTIALDLAIHWNYDDLGSKTWHLFIPPALSSMLNSLQPQSLVDILVLGVHLHVFRDSAFRTFNVVPIEQLGSALEGAPWAGIRRLEVVGAWGEHAERGALRDFQAMVMDRLPESVSRRAVVVDSSD